MVKLYPPSIEGTIPAFYGTLLTVPFIMNKTVSWNEVESFLIRIKSILNNSIIYATNSGLDNYSKEKLEAYFTIPEGKLTIGTSYKIQIAYKDIFGIIGYYSTVGVVKHTTLPTLTIEGLEQGLLSSNTSSYLGKYSLYEGDTTEKLYSYCFTVYDSNGAIFDTTGDILHNHENDTEIYESIDRYNLNRTMEENLVYIIEYTGITSNNMRVSSPRYRIIQLSTVEPEIKAEVVATMNEENGYVNISLLGNNDDTGGEVSAAGTFVLSRSSSKDNYREWVEVERFALFGDRPSTFKFKDFTVEHGYDYQYSLQQYNKEYLIYSNRMISNIITASFEHSFLFDGGKQLKIKYNPKVSSFKENILESKTNTLGGLFPFFYRNGNVRYKEFPISGLISYQSDEEELFLTNEEMLLDDNKFVRERTLDPKIKSDDWQYFNNLAEETDAVYAFNLQELYKRRDNPSSTENLIGRGRFRTTNLVDYNIVAERTFKMKVLDFLNDGKPKLFRSPEEGNFLVRLMNSSLAPNDQLGRMIHTFNTTATEIDQFDYLKLGQYGLTHIEEPNILQLRWKTYNIREIINYNKSNEVSAYLDRYYSLPNVNNIYSIQCLDMLPGDTILLNFNASSTEPAKDQEIKIGATGAYFVLFDVPPQMVYINLQSQQGQITISYKGELMLQFDTYRKINIADLPVRLFIGPLNEDIRFQMEDIKHQIIKYYFLNFTKRPIVSVIELDDNKYVINGVIYDEIDLEPLNIYLYTRKTGELEYVDGLTGLTIDYGCKIWIDNKEIDITETNDFQLIRPENLVASICFESGVVADVSAQRREIEYDVETERNPISNKYESIESKLVYLGYKEDLQKLIYNATYDKQNEIWVDNTRTDDYYWDKNAGKDINQTNSSYKEAYNVAKQLLNDSYQQFLADIELKLKDKGVNLE